MVSLPVPKRTYTRVGDGRAADPEVVVADSGDHLEARHPGAVQGDVLVAAAELQVRRRR